jgi:hypothetical protein
VIPVVKHEKKAKNNPFYSISSKTPYLSLHFLLNLCISLFFNLLSIGWVKLVYDVNAFALSQGVCTSLQSTVVKINIEL